MAGNIEPGSVELPNLATFSKAAELSSFTAAAKELRLTQAAVSQRIQTLEKALNTSLFHRQGGRVLLTEAGQKLYQFAQKILEMHREARQEVTGHEMPIQGELVLAASSIPGEHLLPALLAGFRQKHPHIQIRATASDSMAVMAQVETGDVSLGLVGRKTDNTHLEFRFLANDRMILILPKDHALAKRKKIHLKQLAEHPLILREVGSGLRHCFDKSLEKAGYSFSEFQISLARIIHSSSKTFSICFLHGICKALLKSWGSQCRPPPFPQVVSLCL